MLILLFRNYPQNCSTNISIKEIIPGNLRVPLCQYWCRTYYQCSRAEYISLSYFSKLHAQSTKVLVFSINNRTLGFLFPSNPRLHVTFFIFWCYIFTKKYIFFGCITDTISMLTSITNIALDPQTLVCRTFTCSPTNALNPFYFLPLYLSHFSFVLGYRKANWRWPTMGGKMQAIPKPISSRTNQAHKRNVSGNYPE